MNNKAVQYGVIAGIVGIICGLIPYLFFADGMTSGKPGFHSIFSLISLVVLIICMVKSANARKAVQRGHLLFKEALKETFLVSAVSSVLSYVVVTILSLTVLKDVFQSVKNGILENTLEKLEDRGMSEEVIDQTMGMTENMMNIMAWAGLPIALIFGFIIALIISAIVQKKKPEHLVEVE